MPDDGGRRRPDACRSSPASAAAWRSRAGWRSRRRSAGAHGILALPPYYPHADEDGLLAYYAAIGAATSRGLLVYSRDWVNPGPAFVERLAERLPTPIAWKDGQGDVRRYQIVMARRGRPPALDRRRGRRPASAPTIGSGIRVYTSSISNVAPAPLARACTMSPPPATSRTLPRLMRDYVVPLYALRARRKGYEVIGDEGDDGAARPGRRAACVRRSSRSPTPRWTS